MKIRQILNNNVALVSKGPSEIIVYSKGISFRKRPGQSISEDEIEKTYVLDSHDMLEHFSYLLSNTDEESFNVANDIISFAEHSLKERINDYVYLTILDHVDFALKRAKKGQYIQSPLTWDVKKFYPKQFEIGLYALKRMEEKFHFVFPEDEAVSIALHFVNLQSNKEHLHETIQDMQTLKDILSIIQFHFSMVLDEKSLNYSRLVTYLRYFIERMRLNKVYEDNDKELNAQVRLLYPKAYECALKIRHYIRENFHIEITIDEETYLILHIHRVTTRTN